MRLHRFYISQKIGEEKEITLADPELIHQLINVFRFSAGDKVILFDGSGFEYETEIISLDKKEISVKIISSQAKTAADKNISLYLSIIKKANFELAAEKCTEVGVAEIHPVLSERSEKKDLNIERLEKIVKEASEQSGQVTLPKVMPITDLDIAVSQAVKENKVCLAFHTGEGIENIKQADLSRGNNIAIFVGPEGGFTEKEMTLFKKNNFKIYSLGQNILRAETAAVIATWKSLE